MIKVLLEYLARTASRALQENEELQEKQVNKGDKEFLGCPDHLDQLESLDPWENLEFREHLEFLEKLEGRVNQERKVLQDHLDLRVNLDFLDPRVCLDSLEKEVCQDCLECQDSREKWVPQVHLDLKVTRVPKASMDLRVHLALRVDLVHQAPEESQGRKERLEFLASLVLQVETDCQV